jgi:hypothetical protein
MSSGNAVLVDVEARGIPPQTVVTLHVYPESPADLSIVNLPPAQAVLTGTVELSTARVSFTFPYGFSRRFHYAVWPQ